MTPPERVEKNIDRFIDEIGTLWSAHYLFLRLFEQRQEDVAVLNEAHLFFNRVFEAIDSKIIMSLSKLYEGGSDRNLRKIVNYVQSNWKSVDWENPPITDDRDLTKEHHKLLDEQEDIVSNVISRRNKFHAHHDKDYFLDTDDLTEDFPLDENEIEGLIEVAERIVGDYDLALRGSRVDMKITTDVGAVFRALGEFYQDGDYSFATRDW